MKRGKAGLSHLLSKLLSSKFSPWDLFISPQPTTFKNVKIFDFPYRYANCLCVLTWSRGCVALAAPRHVTACTFLLGPYSSIRQFLLSQSIGALNLRSCLFEIIGLFSQKVRVSTGGGLLSFPFFFCAQTPNFSRGHAATRQLLTYHSGHVC